MTRTHIFCKPILLVGIVCMMGVYAIFACSSAGYSNSLMILSVERQGKGDKTIDDIVSAQAGTDAKIWNRSWVDETKTITNPKKIQANVTSVYTLGTTEEAEPWNKDIFLNRYNTSGDFIWTQSFGGPGREECGDLCMNDSFVYVVGYSSSYRSWGDALILLKYDYLGNLVWNRTWGDPESHQKGLDIYCRGEYIYLVGEYKASIPAPVRLLFMQWNSTGDLQWWHIWSGSARDFGTAIHGDSSYIYTLGYSEPILAEQKDICVQKWSLDGILQWDTIFGSAYEEVPNDIWCQDGFLYIIGDYNNSNGMFTMKYDTDGSEIWNNISKISTGGEVYGGKGIWSDGEYVYTTGSNLMLKWDLDGELQWHRKWNTLSSGFGIFGVSNDIYTFGEQLIKWDRENYDPSLTEEPADSEYVVGDSEVAVKWKPHDYEAKETSYKVLVDNEEIQSGNWEDGDEIGASLNGWSMGAHNVTLILWDGAGGMTQHSITMTGSLMWWIAGIGGGFGILAIVGFVLKNKRKSLN